jgi:hypothetical protein
MIFTTQDVENYLFICVSKMVEINVQEIINELPEEGVVPALLGSEELRKGVADLLVELYEREDLSDLREQLRAQTVVPENLHRRGSPFGEGDFSTLDVEGNDELIRAIAKMRQAVQTTWIGTHIFPGPPRKELIAILTDTKDGDLAMSYAQISRGDLCIENREAFAWMDAHKPIFSPEFQVEMVRLLQEDEDSCLEEFSILMDRFMEKRLAKQAYRALLEGPMTCLIVYMILQDDEIDPEILKIITSHSKYGLVYKAKNDAEAQKELYDRRDEYDIDICLYLAGFPGLVNEEVARQIAGTEEGMARYWLSRNEDVLERMPWIRELVERRKE